MLPLLCYAKGISVIVAFVACLGGVIYVGERVTSWVKAHLPRVNAVFGAVGRLLFLIYILGLLAMVIQGAAKSFCH